MKEEAKELRRQGLTYREISERTGVSVDWCKRNLKGVKSNLDLCIDELVEKATRPGGISQYEATAIIYRYHKGVVLSKQDIKNIKARATYKDENCLFRPAWVDPVKPVESYKALMAYTDHLIDEVDRIVELYRESFPNTNKRAIRYEIVKHLFPFVNKEPLSLHIKRSEDMTERLASLSLAEVDIEEELCEEESQSVDVDIDLKQRDTPSLSEKELDEIWIADT